MPDINDFAKDLLLEAIRFMLDEMSKEEEYIDTYLNNFKYNGNFSERKNRLFLAISTYIRECERLGVPVTKFLSLG